MRRILTAAGALSLLLALVTGACVLQLLGRGISARDEPTPLEAAVARAVRHWAVPARLRRAENPVAASPEVLARGRAHFADHCASCHGNDGRGRTQLGRSLYPKAPDMTLAGTQSLSDGELFAIIENGVRLTGMPAWGRPAPDDDAESWELVHFIRHLPEITPDEIREMESLNPRSRSELEEEEAMRRFLAGEAAPPLPRTEGHRH